MTGVEVFNISTVESAKARVATFKLEELSGPDCVQQVLTELKKCGTIGKVRADYSNALLEVECDKTAVTDDKIIAALNAGQHPGRLTTEKIAATK
jgi:copper chaperone CopZ